MTEREHAIRLAEKVLGQADDFGAVDPDGDMAVLARQLLRALESAPEPKHQYLLRSATTSFAYSALAPKDETHRYVIVWAATADGKQVTFHMPRLLAARLASDIQRVVGDGLPAPIGE